MSYEVRITKKAEKSAAKMPKKEKAIFVLLVDELRKNGPIQKSWRNFSDLGNNKYHCHISYHWVVCWTWEKGSIKIEVNYAGSRESAPY